MLRQLRYGAEVTIAMTLAAGGDAELLEASVAFHLHAGVDYVTVVGAGDELASALDRFVAIGRVAVCEGVRSSEAVPRGDIDWEIDTAAGEFWWPRGGSLGEILATVPRRYDAVQALARTVLRRDGKPFFEHAALRLAPTTPVHDVTWRPARRLVRRGSGARAGGDGSELCVLRLWYPIEVLCVRGAPDEPTQQQALDVGTLVEDTRLRDALRSLRGPEGAGWLVPSTDGKHALEFLPISPADDALFALEVAAAEEVDVVEARELLDLLSRRVSAVERMMLVRFEARLRAGRREVRRRLRGGGAAS